MENGLTKKLMLTGTLSRLSCVGFCVRVHFFEAVNGDESGTDRQTDGWKT